MGASRAPWYTESVWQEATAPLLLIGALALYVLAHRRKLRRP